MLDKELKKIVPHKYLFPFDDYSENVLFILYQLNTALHSTDKSKRRHADFFAFLKLRSDIVCTLLHFVK